MSNIPEGNFSFSFMSLECFTCMYVRTAHACSAPNSCHIGARIDQVLERAEGKSNGTDNWTVGGHLMDKLETRAIKTPLNL